MIVLFNCFLLASRLGDLDNLLIVLSFLLGLHEYLGDLIYLSNYFILLEFLALGVNGTNYNFSSD
jgi:hypothetical protein